MSNDIPQPQGDEVQDSPVDRMRDAPVGTNDPNIVGDVGPTDVPPGTDPPSLDPLPRDDISGEPLEPPL
jgi:hypothetical protein